MARHFAGVPCNLLTELLVVVPVAITAFFYASILEYSLPLFFGALNEAAAMTGGSYPADIWSKLVLIQVLPWIVGPVVSGVEGWFGVTIRADVGPDSDETWSLALKRGDKKIFDKKDLKGKDHIPLLDYVGFMSTGQQQAEIFLDNVSIHEVDAFAGDAK